MFFTFNFLSAFWWISEMNISVSLKFNQMFSWYFCRVNKGTVSFNLYWSEVIQFHSFVSIDLPWFVHLYNRSYYTFYSVDQVWNQRSFQEYWLAIYHLSDDNWWWQLYVKNSWHCAAFFFPGCRCLQMID